MIDIKMRIAEQLGRQIPALSADDIRSMLEYPPKPEMGDIALPCFKLARTLRKSPADIAQDLRNGFGASACIDKLEVVSGYLNFYLDKGYLVTHTLNTILVQGNKYGSRDVGKGENVVIDFSAPNIAKPFHVGHLRSTVIGKSLYRIFEFMGYNCIGINHLGDWGTQFGKLITAYKHWGVKENVDKGGIRELTSLYVRFHQEAETNDTLNDEAREWFSRMEQGDSDPLQLWQWFKETSLREFQKTYAVLDVDFDSYAGESFYNDKMGEVIAELRDKGLLTESNGATVVDLEEYGMPPCLILKKDGSTLYATRDITAAFYRKKTYDFAKCIYVTAAAQNLHFRQWIKVIELMGYSWAKDLIHVPFGIVSLEGEKLSTRRGNVVLLEDILSEAIRKAASIIEEKSPAVENRDELARHVGVGAVVFSDLIGNRINDVSFSWDEILNFDGATGPYVQYTYARTCSVLRKAGNEGDGAFDAQLLGTLEEYQLVKTLSYFPERVWLTMQDMEPSIISRYLIDLCQDFNRFYHGCPILRAEPDLRGARLILVKAVRTTLANGMGLIGLYPTESI